MQVAAKELRTRTAEILRAVQDGEHVTVTYRGREIAEIRPLNRKRYSDSERKAIEDDVFGMWADREDMKDPSKWVRELREERENR
jgi:prevent-host-death family protein